MHQHGRIKMSGTMKSESMRVVYDNLRQASVGQLRDMYRESQRRFYMASSEDDSFHHALFMHQIKYELYRRLDKKPFKVNRPVDIRKEMKCG
jgi:hypothetical protein